MYTKMYSACNTGSIGKSYKIFPNLITVARYKIKISLRQIRDRLDLKKMLASASLTDCRSPNPLLARKLTAVMVANVKKPSRGSSEIDFKPSDIFVRPKIRDSFFADGAEFGNSAIEVKTIPLTIAFAL
jgi:hypothetical protein